MGTWSAGAADIDKQWIVIDAQDVVVGRLASFIARRLRGKHLARFTPHLDCGDHVIVVNAEKAVFSGQKYENKVYHWHTGYPGGIKQRTARELFEGRFPERVLHKAVERMMPGGPLSRQQLRGLKIYAGATHPHEAQQPELIDFGGLNRKNIRK